MSMDSICILLRHGICCMDMVYALGRWDMLYGHGKCLVVGEEYMDMEDVFLLDKIIWIYKMSSYHIL